MTLRSIDIGRLQRPQRVEAGAPPMLQWLAIADLRIDETYQRDLKGGNWNAIKRIAAAFSWTRFSPVFVAPIEGGLYAVIDGQHRVTAAKACGFDRVPCQIVQMSQAEQAASFAAVNGLVTKVTAWQVYKAALAAGEDWARECAAIATEAGCQLMTGNASHWTKKPGQIYGVNSFRHLARAYPRANLVRALQMVRASDDGNAECWDTSVLRPMLAAMCQRPHAMERPDFVAAIAELDIISLADEIAASNRERIRRGLPYLAKKEALEARVVDWIDTRFPVRIAGRPEGTLRVARDGVPA